MIKLKKIEVYRMTAYDFEKMIKKEYKQTIDFHNETEINTGFQLFEINKLTLRADQREALETFITEGQGGDSTSNKDGLIFIVLTDMVRRKIIPKGNYLIEGPDY